MTNPHQAEAMQGAAAATVGVAAQYLVGPDALWVLLAAMCACTIADAGVPATTSRSRLAVRYIASVGVSFATAHVVSAWADVYHPDWRSHLFEVKLAAAVAVSLVLHLVIGMLPRVLLDSWDALLQRVRGTTDKGST